MAANAEDRNTDKRNKCQRLFSQNRLLVLLVSLIIFGVVVGALLLFVIPALLKKEPRPYRLPTNIIPYQYGLEIKPYLTPNSWFEGQVEIYVTCAKKTDTIVLHSENLTIDENSIHVSSVDGHNFKVLLVNYDSINELLILRLLDDLKQRQKYRIYIKYKGPLEETGMGFFISSYSDDKNITHYVASTHFEPVRARMAFPCFDEPEFKSSFNITLVRWRNMTSLSNMPRLRTEYRGDNWEADIFEKSMRMSTYLVAFVFCDYVNMTKGKIAVWAPKHREDNAKYAMNMSHKLLQFFERKLEMPYPGPKLDMVPISEWGGAMENWGLIIYGFNDLLTPENRSEETRVSFTRIASTVAHEIAHQWFGNLVTMKWWSDLWLNEGITSYMEDLASAELLPDWNQIDPTIHSVYHIISEDCSESEPIWRPVYSSKDARRNFGGGTYFKGAMITRMAHQILGEEVFWKGMRRYLNVNAYENVKEADLWKSLTLAQSSGRERLDMAEIMHPWTHVSGIPVVTFTRDYERRTAKMFQQSCKSYKKEYENDLWNIPIIIETRYDVNLLNKITWLKMKNMTVEGMPNEHEWVVVNSDSTGFYIVNYDRENWNLLFKQLLSNHEIFEPTGRFKLLTEIMTLESMDYVEIDLVFECFLYITKERDVTVLNKHMRFLQMYINHFDEDKYSALMREFIIHIWKNLYDRYGWLEKDDNKLLWWEEMKISYVLVQSLCDLEYGPCLEEAFNRYTILTKDNTTMVKRGHDNNNWLALCTATRNATYEGWKDIKDTHFNEESNNLSFALECSKDASIIREELNSDMENIKDYAFGKLIHAGSQVSFSEILHFVDKHFDEIVEKEFEIPEWARQWINKGISISRIRQIMHLLSKHLNSLSGSNEENVESFLEYLKKRLPVLEKKTMILKKWLERKPWRQIL